jgi:hypothetical protein
MEINRFPEQYDSLESQQNPNVTLNSLTSMNVVDNINNLTEHCVFKFSVCLPFIQFLIVSTYFFVRKIACSNIKLSHKPVFGFTLFTSIVMSIAIAAVYLTLPKPSMLMFIILRSQRFYIVHFTEMGTLDLYQFNSNLCKIISIVSSPREFVN